MYLTSSQQEQLPARRPTKENGVGFRTTAFHYVLQYTLSRESFHHLKHICMGRKTQFLTLRYTQYYSGLIFPTLSQASLAQGYHVHSTYFPASQTQDFPTQEPLISLLCATLRLLKGGLFLCFRYQCTYYFLSQMF